MRIAVLYGGTSKEREVSLSTGEGMIKALRHLGHDVVAIDFNPAKLTQHINDLENVDFVLIDYTVNKGKMEGFKVSWNCWISHISARVFLLPL